MYLQIQLYQIQNDRLVAIIGMVNCQNSQDKGPPEFNSARG